jgi:hypothetical protein
MEDIYIIPVKNKPVKIVFESSSPCPIIPSHRCKNAEIIWDDMNMVIRCNDPKNCDKLKGNTFGVCDVR